MAIKRFELGAKRKVSWHGTTANLVFPQSIIKTSVYRGDVGGLSKFKRPAWGLWVTSIYSVVERYYADSPGKAIYVLYADARKMYLEGSGGEFDEELKDYEMGDPKIARVFKKMEAAGYDSFMHDSETDSVSLFKSVRVVDALSGRKM